MINTRNRTKDKMQNILNFKNDMTNSYFWSYFWIG